MYPPVFATVSANATVQGLIGSSPCRLYPFGEAPENVTKPYAVWDVVDGEPEGYVDKTPNIDLYTVYIDVIAETAAQARSVLAAIKAAVEPVAHVTAWPGEEREGRDYLVTLEAQWWVTRTSAAIAVTEVTNDDGYPPVFDVLNDDADVLTTFGSGPTRIYPFGEVPENATMPYAAWAVTGGAPENYLNQTPDVDRFQVSLQVFDDTATGARDAAEDIRLVLEQYADVQALSGEDRQPDTRAYSYTMQADWWGVRLAQGTSGLLLEGDMQSGTDYLLLEGDMQSGTDNLLLEGSF